MADSVDGWSWRSVSPESLSIRAEPVSPEDGGGWRAWTTELGSHGLQGDGDSEALAVENLLSNLERFQQAEREKI